MTRSSLRRLRPLHHAIATAFVALVLTVPVSAQTSAHESQAVLRAEAKVSMKAARKAALALVPGGRVKSSELERENGRLLYSFDIATRGKAGIDEVQIDALTGAQIGTVKHESKKDEEAERRVEAKEMKPDTKSNRRHTIPLKPDVVLKPEAASR